MGRKKKIQDVTEGLADENIKPGTLVVHQNILDTVSKAFDKDFAMLLVGDTGTGKTSLIRQESHKRGKTFTRINLNGQTDTSDILGKWLIKDRETVWQDGLLTKAVREGHALLLDEINACPAEVLFALHGLLEDARYLVLVEKDGEIVSAHPDFRLFATMNPSEGYEGTRELNRAFLSRFKIVLNLDYTESETEVLVEQYGMETGLASKLVQFAKETRATFKAQASDFLISTRDLINVAQLMTEGFSMEESLDLAIINKANPTEAPALRQLLELVMGLKVKDYETGETLHDLTKIKESYDKLAKDHNANKDLVTTHEYLLGRTVDELLMEIQNGAFLARKIIFRQSTTTPNRSDSLQTSVDGTRELGGIRVPNQINIHGVADSTITINWNLDPKEHKASIFQMHRAADQIRLTNFEMLAGKIGAEAWKKKTLEVLNMELAGMPTLDQLRVAAINFMEYILTDNPPVVTNTIEAVQIN